MSRKKVSDTGGVPYAPAVPPPPNTRRRTPEPAADAPPPASRVRGSNRTRTSSGETAQYTVRMGADLYQALRAESDRINRSYSAVLASAYLTHHKDLADHSASAAAAAWGPARWRPRRLGEGSRRIQFHLSVSQGEMLDTLAERTGQSFAGVVRDLLTRYLLGDA